MSAPFPDASLCPLCGRSNQCAILAGIDPLNCWCMDTPVAPDALARIPEPMR
ncbi:cysteine-rich CWC family protein, partial [Burkholderia sola]